MPAIRSPISNRERLRFFGMLAILMRHLQRRRTANECGLQFNLKTHSARINQRASFSFPGDGAMALPVVAIVGRPNVGKSSLFNSLAGKRIAIVDPTPGVTRDRVSAPIEMEDGFFELFDTGGIGNEDVDNLTDEIEGQIDTAIMQAAVILFVVDIREGVTGLDQHV